MKDISKFYKEFVTSEDFTEEMQDELRHIRDERKYRDFIMRYIIPKAIEKGYTFSVDDILRYEKIILDSLSEEELANVAGGRLDVFEAFVPHLMLAFHEGLVKI